MSQEPNTTDPQDDPQPTEPADQPKDFVSREDYETLRAQMAHMGETLSYLRGQAEAAGRPVAPPPPAEPTVSDEQLAEMLESGDGQQILKAQRYIQSQESKRLEALNEQRYQQVVALGTAITARQIKSDYPLYHSDPAIKRDVDAMFAQVPAEARANPEAWDLIYRQVLGAPQHQERIFNQRVEEEIRRRSGQAQVGDPADRPVGRTQSSTKPGAVPTMNELFGDEIAKTFRNMGEDDDAAAQRLGYKNWEDYFNKTEIDTTWPS